MLRKEMPRRRGFLFLTPEEIEQLITALERQAVEYVRAIATSEAHPSHKAIPPRVWEKYRITLSLLTAALEYRANYYRELPDWPRNDEAWSRVLQ